MATGRIKKESVEAIEVPPAGKRAYLWDDRLKGFGVMVMPSGVRSYIVQYRLGGRGHPTRRATVGQHGSPWTAEKARSRAQDLLELIRKGIDPVEAERNRAGELLAQKKIDAELAFSTFADTFIAKHVDGRGMRSADDIKGVFRRDLKPWFKDKPLPSITRDDIHDLLDHIGERSESASNKAHKWLRKFFNYAVDKKSKYLAASPMHAMSPPYDDGERTRVLKGIEIKQVWDASAQLSGPFRDLVRLLLLTGQRLREVAGMQWKEIDLDKAEWIIPAARTKNKRQHLVPLSPQVIAILNAIAPNKEARKGCVLTTNGKTPISGFSKAKAHLDGEVAKLVAKANRESDRPKQEFANWVYHDLRRTLATGCQGLGILESHTEAVLNHVSGTRGGIRKIYQLYEFQPEKKRALEIWGQHVSGLIAFHEAEDGAR